MGAERTSWTGQEDGQGNIGRKKIAVQNLPFLATLFISGLFFALSGPFLGKYQGGIDQRNPTDTYFQFFNVFFGSFLEMLGRFGHF